MVGKLNFTFKYFLTKPLLIIATHKNLSLSAVLTTPNRSTLHQWGDGALIVRKQFP